MPGTYFPGPRRGSLSSSLGYQRDYTDPSSSLVWMGARWYSPELARFLSPDPLAGEREEPLSLNLYPYCAHDPVNNSDPEGKTYMGDEGWLAKGYSPEIALGLAVTGMPIPLEINIDQNMAITFSVKNSEKARAKSQRTSQPPSPKYNWQELSRLNPGYLACVNAFAQRASTRIEAKLEERKPGYADIFSRKVDKDSLPLVLKHLNEMRREGVLTDEEITFILAYQTPLRSLSQGELNRLFEEQCLLEKGLQSYYGVDKVFISLVVSAYAPRNEVLQEELVSASEKHLKETIPSWENPWRLLDALAKNPLTKLVIGIYDIVVGIRQRAPEVIASGFEDVSTAFKDLIHGNFYGEEEYRWEHGYSVP